MSEQERAIAARLLSEARRELARLPQLLEVLLGDLEEPSASTRPAPDEWAPIEVLCHLRDEETEDFGARLRAALDGATEFAPIDPERWVEERRYRSNRLDEVLRQLSARRAANVDVLASLAPEQLGAAVPHRRLGQLSGLDLLAAWVTHDRLHLAQLASILARLWAMQWPSLRAEYAGPIPYAPGAAVLR
jgi:hypothetical protein